MASLAGVDLGRVQAEQIKSTAGVLTVPIPDQDAADTILIPTTGPISKIVINGLKTGDLSTLQTFVAYLEDWIEKGGKISEANLTFIGDLNFTAGASVRVVDGSWDWVAGNPRKVTYSIEMIRGSFN